jgi:hypothetical protein
LGSSPSESIEIFDEISHFFSNGIAKGAISKKKNGKDRGKILDFERIEPKTQVITIRLDFSVIFFYLSGHARHGSSQTTLPAYPRRGPKAYPQARGATGPRSRMRRV